MATMSQSWLRSGDQVRYWGKEGPRRALRITLLGGVTFGLLGACSEVWAYGYTSFPLLFHDFAGDSVVSAVFLFLLFSHRREVILTSDRLLSRQGFLGTEESEVPIAEISKITGGDTENGPFELVLSSGESLQIRGLPDLGQLRDALAKVIGP